MQVRVNIVQVWVNIVQGQLVHQLNRPAGRPPAAGQADFARALALVQIILANPARGGTFGCNGAALEDTGGAAGCTWVPFERPGLHLGPRGGSIWIRARATHLDAQELRLGARGVRLAVRVVGLGARVHHLGAQGVRPGDMF